MIHSSTEQLEKFKQQRQQQCGSDLAFGAFLSTENLTFRCASVVYKAPPPATIVAIQTNLCVYLGASPNTPLEQLSKMRRPVWLLIGGSSSVSDNCWNNVHGPSNLYVLAAHAWYDRQQQP
uniref:Uncharacterized protein n=1 Tax=Pseudo-nitzschia australis TaxID=44445 RepID=A0A7S4EKR9_9STRA